MALGRHFPRGPVCMPADTSAQVNIRVGIDDASVGQWRSLVAHLLREQGVGGSNPLCPTNFSAGRMRFGLNSRQASGSTPGIGTAVVLVCPVPFRDPVEVLQAFAGDPVLAFLDSAAADPRSRYSYLAVEPYTVLTAGPDGVRVDGHPVAGDPFTVLKAQMQPHRTAPEAGPVPFRGGAVGYLAYESARHVDRFPDPPKDPHAILEMVAGLYDVVFAFDLRRRQCWLLSSGLPEPSAKRRSRRAAARAQAVLARLPAVGEEIANIDWSVRGQWQAERPRAAVERAIARVIDYIQAGDIFQANLTQRMLAERPLGLDDAMLYRRLRAISPAPFAALLRCGPELSVLSASPERFLGLSVDGRVETRPIKGTRRRDANPAIDAALARELVASAKDRAENLMIVDLMRNDLGRVCRVGSIEVPALQGLETFASVHHLVSVVTGRLNDGLGPVDLLRACFPGGSITGAPKIRAMEIIAELEARQRGACFGSVFWIGDDGAMDSSIAIRTIVRTGNMLLAEAGGGIVADSDPAAEYDEAILKLQPLLRALTGDRP